MDTTPDEPDDLFNLLEAIIVQADVVMEQYGSLRKAAFRFGELVVRASAALAEADVDGLTTDLRLRKQVLKLKRQLDRLVAFVRASRPRSAAETVAYVDRVDVVPTGGGHALVTIGLHGPFPLPARLADALLALCEDVGGDPGDGLVDFKTPDMLVAQLGKPHTWARKPSTTGVAGRPGRGPKIPTVSRNAVRNLVYRLREALEGQGLARELVQSDRRLGYRFRLRRRGA